MHIRINNNLGSLPVRRRAVVLFEDGREREEEEEEDGREREKRRREDGTGVTEGEGPTEKIQFHGRFCNQSAGLLPVHASDEGIIPSHA